MKNLSIFLTALAAAAAPVFPGQEMKALSNSVITMTDTRSGKEAVAGIREGYTQGAYDQVLKELDDFYLELSKNKQLDQLSEMRGGLSPVLGEWEARASALQDERNQKLLEAVADEKKTPFVEKILTASAAITDTKHQKAIDRVASLRAMVPGQGKSADENRLIDLDLEYEAKSLHIDLPGKPASDKREKLIALKMEMVGKMVDASKNFKDVALKEAVELYAENFDARLAQSWDAADLNALANGKRKPANALEEKVSAILILYQEKFNDLSRQFLAENEVL
jgi:hypothetical protein